MKKRLAVLFKLTFLVAIFSLVFVSADSYCDSSCNQKEFVNTGPIINYNNCNCYNNYYTSYSKSSCNTYYPKYENKYYYEQPKFTDYKVRSYGHGLQLVRFKLDNYYKDHPNYKTNYEIGYNNCHKTGYRNTCYN